LAIKARGKPNKGLNEPVPSGHGSRRLSFGAGVQIIPEEYIGVFLLTSSPIGCP